MVPQPVKNHHCKHIEVKHTLRYDTCLDIKTKMAMHYVCIITFTEVLEQYLPKRQKREKGRRKEVRTIQYCILAG